ncbi:hypothetical protein IPQ61_20985, partial [Xanthomonas perforans]|nr:hypothetical protein [Xanthomonas perforans]MBZ3567438.1 hypothetical protein [Xanthomonas perforans]MBZ3606442.1 hypothetical protein [Xanthomonas perforans]
ARVGLFDKPDDLLGAESALLHVRPLGFTDFIASAGTAQWGQVTHQASFAAYAITARSKWKIKEGAVDPIGCDPTVSMLGEA